MTQLLGPGLVIYRHDNGVGNVSSEVVGVRNPSTPESALIDMRLLSECDDLVITVASSYGTVAAAWGGIAPVQMLHGAHKNVQVCCTPWHFHHLGRCKCCLQLSMLARVSCRLRCSLRTQNPYWYRAITSEPCYWHGQIFLNNDDPFWGKLGEKEVAAFKSNPFWMQYVQCHCSQ